MATLTVPHGLKTPYIKQLETDLAAVNGPKSISFSTAVACAEADLLVSQLKAVGPDLNTKSWDGIINDGNYVYKPSVEGGTGQMSFPAMHFISADCGITLKVGGTAFVRATPYTCADSEVLAGTK